MILYNFKNLLPKNENITEYHAMLRVRTSIKKEFLLRVMSNILYCVYYTLWNDWHENLIKFYNYSDNFKNTSGMSANK